MTARECSAGILERLRAVRWQPAAEDVAAYPRSRGLLFGEYLRRSAIWARPAG